MTVTCMPVCQKMPSNQAGAQRRKDIHVQGGGLRLQTQNFRDAKPDARTNNLQKTWRFKNIPQSSDTSIYCILAQSLAHLNMRHKLPPYYDDQNRSRIGLIVLLIQQSIHYILNTCNMSVSKRRERKLMPDLERQEYSALKFSKLRGEFRAAKVTVPR